jgi:hypothetical protein
MRAATIPPLAIIAIGAYLMIAASLALSPTWIAIGTLAIAVTAAIAIVSAQSRSAPSR